MDAVDQEAGGVRDEGGVTLDDGVVIVDNDAEATVGSVVSEAMSLEEDSDAGSSSYRTTMRASVTATMAVMTFAHDWMVTRRSVDNIRESTGKCRLSGLDSVQRR